MENQSLSFTVRRRAAACALASVLWFPIACVVIYLPSVLEISLLQPLLTAYRSQNLNLALFTLFFGLPAIGMILATPIVALLWIRNRSMHPFIDRSGLNVTNFMLSYSLYLVIATLVVLGMMRYGDFVPESVALLMSYPLLFSSTVILLVQAGVAVIGVVFVLKGQVYRYPFMIQFLGRGKS